MDITSFVVKRRNDALLVGDYGSYRQQLSRQLLTLRRRLGRTSSKGKKYTPKAPITAQDVCSNPESVRASLVISYADKS
jgi:signal recognition particle subunit SRP68